MIWLAKHLLFRTVTSVFLFYWKMPRTECHNATTIVAYVGDSVTMTCSRSDPKELLRWNYGINTTLFNWKTNIAGDSNVNISLNKNTYNLIINPVRTRHEGKYTCRGNHLKKNLTFLFVQVTPVAIIKLGEQYYQFDDSYIGTDPIYVNVNESLTAECYADATSEVNLTWTINDDVVNSSETNITNLTRGKHTYSRTAVGLITVLDGEQGEISCTNNGRVGVPLHRISVSIPYNTYELPELTLDFGKVHEQNDTLYFELGQLVEVTCSSVGGRPTPTLSWLVNGVNDTNIIGQCRDNTSSSDKTSCIQYTPESSHENITCVAVLGNTSFEARMERRLHVYVCPNITLMVNREENENAVVIDKDHESFAICRVQETSNKFTLNFEHSKIEALEKNDKDTENEIIMTFLLSTGHGNITCVYRDDYLCHVRKFVTLTTPGKNVIEDKQVTGTVDEILNHPFFYPVIGLIVVITTIIILVLFLRRKCHATNNKGPTNTYNLHQPMSSRVLPSIDVNDDVVENVSNSFQEKFTALNNDYATGTLNRSDVQLSFQLPGEGTMKYWLASTTTGYKEETKIIAKTLSEDARMKEVMNFRILAENLMSLNKHENMVKVLGVALDNVPYYIYQEYITCGTLKDFLLRNYQQSGDSGDMETSPPPQSDCKTIQLTAVTLDVCEGMLFLAKQTYRHPALTTRKVLLSSTGRCKLYDFWPAELAQERMKNLLELKVPPLAWLAPESVFLGQYVEKSDVWNFGVVAWEVFSLGDTPFGGLTCSEIESNLRAKENLSQPLTCPGGLFGVLLSTWNASAEERPSFGYLQQTLTSFLTEMEQSSLEEHKENESNYFILAADEDVDFDDYVET